MFSRPLDLDREIIIVRIVSLAEQKMLKGNDVGEDRCNARYAISASDHSAYLIAGPSSG